MRSILVVLLTLAITAPASAAYDESQNWLNAYGRTVEHFSAPDRSVGTALVSAQNVLDTLADAGRIPDRGMQQTGAWPWSGDPDRGSYGQMGSWTGRKIEFESPNGRGQSLTGTVWAPSDEMLAALELEAPLPGIVYAPGVISAQPMYYWFAQDMAKEGYVVMTYDLTGQGRSEGQSQTDHVADLRAALEFFTSSANPLLGMVDLERLGTAGHSLGASAVQAVGDWNGRIKAISAHSDMNSSYTGNAPLQGQGADYESFVFPPQPSPGADPDGKLGAFPKYRDRGLDVQEIVIESGTHMAWSHVTWAYTATWSEPVALWYALAWFDRYLYADKVRQGLTATERLTTSFDAGGGHGLSRKFRSAYSLDGVTCLDMVAGCATSKSAARGRGRSGCTARAGLRKRSSATSSRSRRKSSARRSKRCARAGKASPKRTSTRR